MCALILQNQECRESTQHETFHPQPTLTIPWQQEDSIPALSEPEPITPTINQEVPSIDPPPQVEETIEPLQEHNLQLESAELTTTTRSGRVVHVPSWYSIYEGYLFCFHQYLLSKFQHLYVEG